MRQRVLLAVLVPALVGAMVGVAVAVSRVGVSPADPVVLDTVESPDTPAPTEGSQPAAAGHAGDPSRLVAPEPAPTTAPVEAAVDTPPPPPPPPPPAYDVAAVQQRLTELRYYVGPVDGAEGPATRSALMAFQKVNSLPVDGAVGQATLAALEAPAAPVLREGPANRIEIDLNIQVLHLIEGGQLARTMPVSSGNGASYTTSSGGKARSLTPVGHFTIERRIRGVRKAPLGTLYDPLYFYRGWAIHGSNSVPAHPASHGCVRVTRADAIWLFDRAPNGMSVSLYGGQHTFPAGSAAPGTDTPAGDVAPAPAPQPEPQPAPEPAPSAGPAPSPPAASPAPPPGPEAPSGQPSPPPGDEPDGVLSPLVPDSQPPEEPSPPDEADPLEHT